MKQPSQRGGCCFSYASQVALQYEGGGHGVHGGLVLFLLLAVLPSMFRGRPSTSVPTSRAFASDTMVSARASGSHWAMTKVSPAMSPKASDTAMPVRASP